MSKFSDAHGELISKIKLYKSEGFIGSTEADELLKLCDKTKTSAKIADASLAIHKKIEITKNKNKLKQLIENFLRSGN